MNTEAFAGLSLLVLAAATFGGCAANADLAGKGEVNTRTVERSTLTPRTHCVRQEDKMFQVAGDMPRRDCPTVRIADHVHAQPANASGESAQSITVRHSLPPGRKPPRTSEPRSPTDHAQLFGPLPDGGTVRVAVCSTVRPAIETQEEPSCSKKF